MTLPNSTTAPDFQYNTEGDAHSIASTAGYLMQAALNYAQRGWRVLPVSRNKVPLITAWPKFASTDPEQIRSWWQTYPNANIGIATGPKSNLWVIDIDIKHGVNGLDSLIERFEHPIFGTQDVCVRSASGGFHLYFQWDESLPVSVAANVLPGIDIRGETGFIMAPPSYVMIDGNTCFYRFMDDNQNIPHAPEWAKTLARMTLNSTPPGGGQQAAAQFSVQAVMEGISEGGRDNALYRYACHLCGCKVPYYLAEGFQREAAARCKPPFDGEIAVNKLQRVYSALSAPTTIFSLNQGDK